MRSFVDIWHALEGESEDARFAAWMELFRSQEESAKIEINKIIKGVNPYPKLLCIRFLAGIPEEEAVSYLAKFLEDNNEIIGNAAKRGLDKNHYDHKNQKLLPLLHSPSRRAQRYAIEKLSRSGIIEALPILLSLLLEADDERLIELLSALRYLPDKRILASISPCLKDSREEVRFRAVLILGALHEAGIADARRHLVSFLRDDSSKIRQATLWGLRKAPVKDDFVHLKTVSLDDPDPNVRRESLLGFSFFPTVETIHHLLKIMVVEQKRIVRLQCEGVLLSMPPQLLTVALKKILKVREDPVRGKAIFLFASLHEKPSSFFDFLVQELKDQKEDRKKIPLLQAFGEMGDVRGIQILEDYLTSSAPIAYAALSALTQLWKRQKNPGLIPYLQNPQFPALLKQMVLRFIARQPGVIQDQATLIQTLVTLLDHENINIRYLSSQILVSMAAESTYDVLLKTFLKETDPTSRKFLADRLSLLGWNHPDRFVSSLIPYKGQTEILSYILSLIQKRPVSRDQFLKLFPALLEPPLALHETVMLNEMARFLLHAIEEDPSFFPLVLPKIVGIAGGFKLLTSFIDLLEARPKPCRFPLPIPFLKNRFETVEEEEKSLIIDLMGLSPERSPIPFLVSVIVNSSHRQLHLKASKALNQMISNCDDRIT